MALLVLIVAEIAARRARVAGSVTPVVELAPNRVRSAAAAFSVMVSAATAVSIRVIAAFRSASMMCNLSRIIINSFRI
jgi:hypothetical protein